MKKLIFSIVIALTASSFAGKAQSNSQTLAAKGKEKTQEAVVKPTASKGLEVIHLDKASFKTLVFDFETLKEWKYNGNMPAILDFYADWCGPCKMLAPHLEQLQKLYKGKLQVYKINTDQNRELSAAFGITSLPTIVFVPMEGQPQASMGYRPLADLETDVKNVLKLSR